MSTRATLESPVGAEIVIDGRRYINFGGSSYLGLSGNPQIIAAGCVALQESGCGYQFARHYQIASRALQDAEAEAARYFGTEAALYLGGGYYFALVSIAALRGAFNVIFFDELAHYSLREAIAASGLANHSFRHLDADDLSAKLKRLLRVNERPLVVSDGLYSTRGDIAPLAELVQAAAPHDGRLLVDESHSFGVLGQLGRGAAEHHHVDASMALSGGSLSKAFGAAGGVIPASAEEVASFRATPAVRGAAPGLPAAAAMCGAALKYAREHPELLQKLRSNVAYMKSGLRRLGIDAGDSIAPVAAFVTGTAESMRTLRERLMVEGIFLFNSTYIGAGADGVIRCGIFADHTTEQMDRLFDSLRRLL